MNDLEDLYKMYDEELKEEYNKGYNQALIDNKDMCIKFADWIDEKDYIKAFRGQHSWYYQDGLDYNLIAETTEQLFNKFKEEYEGNTGNTK